MFSHFTAAYEAEVEGEVLKFFPALAVSVVGSGHRILGGDPREVQGGPEVSLSGAVLLKTLNSVCSWFSSSSQMGCLYHLLPSLHPYRSPQISRPLPQEALPLFLPFNLSLAQSFWKAV